METSHFCQNRQSNGVRAIRARGDRKEGISTESILNTIKKMLGIEANYAAFDVDVAVNINAALMTLNQLGVGPSGGFVVTNEDQTWIDFLGTYTDLEAVKTYIFLKVKGVFDPPTSSTVLEAMNRSASELEWRIRTQVEFLSAAGGEQENDGTV